MSGVGMSSIGSFVKKVERIKARINSLPSQTRIHLLARVVVKKRNYPDVSSGDTITIPITVTFSVSHSRQKHLAVYIVSNEMWKVNWE
jgi:hypothetical protein